ncbi:MAG: nitroreductase family protein [Fimbriimonadaceae bacterium]|nr:MAG: nitroreductase family protein [Fimbriimonadaceae bacterium]
MFEELFAEAWKLRYGTEALPDVEDRLAKFLTHRSVRKYSDQPISHELMSSLIACGQSAATSSNLQLWSVVSVQEPERRTTIAKMCGDQDQVHKAPWFLAFIVDLNRVAQAAESVGENPAALTTAEFYTMGCVDAALAAERILAAAESIGISGCYIGALRNDAYGIKEFLQLPDRCFGIFGLCLGYPAENVQAEIKPRLSQETIWFEEVYDSNRGIGDYDERMTEFYETQGMKGDVTWSMRSGRRVNGSQMTGREVIKQFLADQKLDIE